MSKIGKLLWQDLTIQNAEKLKIFTVKLEVGLIVS